MNIEYARMPFGSENGGTAWMADLPVRYRHGENGFDRRIMEDLAAVGVPCYTLGDLANGPRTIPRGIPVFIDWLGNLDARIPGPETEHRSAIRSGLIRNLIDPAARGNQEAIDLLIAQVRRNPPIPERMQTWACDGLRLIGRPEHFSQIVELLDALPDGTAMYPLIEYLGKVKTSDSRDVAVRYLDSIARGSAIKALVQMKAAGVRDLVEPFVRDRVPSVRKAAARALEKLPE
ncbi:HEAT repeat domain-containing protein [Nocardia sp. NPDC058480]|uniref:HEAT repeat domain-containing protein n=2 Tax=Actinomycetes TaxID=1760 RepID=UPI00365BC3C8